MFSSSLKILAFIAIVGKCYCSDAEFDIPVGLLIGTASSAYQIEGAWNVSGKSESNWDYFIHNNPEKVVDGSNADISCDSYHKYGEDINLMKDIGFEFYRFSLSWSRILPTGRTDIVNQEGLQYYHRVLDELEKRGIKPLVTLYHWDHPQSLEEFGGWLNEEMAYLFSSYARVIFKEFGRRVKYFTTLNEPRTLCEMSYKDGLFPPGVRKNGSGEYICVQNMLKAHALAYHIYNDEFRPLQNGQIGISISAVYSYSQDETDTESSDIAFAFNVGWLANPIFTKDGDYPEIMKTRIAERSKLQGLNASRFPELSKEWIDLLRGSSDYFGLNHYTSDIVSPLPSSEQLSWPDDEGLKHSTDPNWVTSQSSWLKICPEGFGNLLRRIKTHYGNPPVFILENGVSDGNGTQDKMRINYLYLYMGELLKAIKYDGCNVIGYTVWDFLDNFEWLRGYTEQYGLIEVDFKSAEKKRTTKNSALWLKEVLASRKLKPPTSASSELKRDAFWFGLSIQICCGIALKYITQNYI